MINKEEHKSKCSCDYDIPCDCGFDQPITDEDMDYETFLKELEK